MKFLAKALTTGKKTDIVWISQSSGIINRGALSKALSKRPIGEWIGKRIALGALPTFEFVSTLVLLDGVAEAILLLPNEDDAQTRVQRLTQAKIDFVIEGNGLGLSQLLNDSDLGNLSERPQPIQTTWLLPTSGTTGTPKLIAHTLESLTRGMLSRPLSETYIWSSVYSLRRFAGLQVFLQAWISNTTLVLHEESEDLSVVLGRLIETGCNSLSATPSMWRKLNMHPLFEKLTLKQITLGGEIVDQGILDVLAKRFPTARITHIYASTEAGVGFVVRDGKAGFPTEYLTKPHANVALRVDDLGHLWLRSLTNSNSGASGERPWVDSGDVIRVEGERGFFVGRANGSINIGGNKVMPEEVEAVIKELPEIAFVQVRARKSAILGNLIEAAITPKDDVVFDSSLKKKIIEYCRSRLDDFKVPAFVVTTSEIPLTPSGKLSRTSIE